MNLGNSKQEINFNDGSVYKGKINSITNFREGYGIQNWKDGTKYEGSWDNDKANGKGKITHANGDTYQGDWKDDQAHGIGLFISKDGTSYQGEWRNDLQNGKGTETWPD